MSVIASTDHNQNDDVLFDRRTLEKLKNMDIEELDYNESGNEDEQVLADGDIVISGKSKEA